MNPTKVTLMSEWGPNDPEVESIWIIFKEAIRKIDDDKVRDEADFRADRIYEKLNEARAYYQEINKERFENETPVKKNAQYKGLYSSLWSAYKDRLPKMTNAIGYNINFVFANDKEYELQIKAFEKNNPEIDWFKAYINIQKSNWQDKLRDYRNPNEHDGDFRNNKEFPDLNNTIEAKKMFIQATRAIEGIGISLLSYKLPQVWNVIILNNRSTVFDRLPRYEIRHSIMK